MCFPGPTLGRESNFLQKFNERNSISVPGPSEVGRSGTPRPWQPEEKRGLAKPANARPQERGNVTMPLGTPAVGGDINNIFMFVKTLQSELLLQVFLLVWGGCLLWLYPLTPLTPLTNELVRSLFCFKECFIYENCLSS